MSEQEQNHNQEATDGATEFKVPDCCGPAAARMMKAFGSRFTANGETDFKIGGTGAPSCCESMMARMREACSESADREDGQSSLDEEGSGCCS